MYQVPETAYFTPQGDQTKLVSRSRYSSQGDAAGEALPFFALVIGVPLLFWWMDKQSKAPARR